MQEGLPDSVEFPDICTKEFNKAANMDLHICGPNCGHIAILHNGHIDYLVPNIKGSYELRHPHGSHCDWHGTITKERLEGMTNDI